MRDKSHKNTNQSAAMALNRPKWRKQSQKAQISVYV